MDTAYPYSHTYIHVTYPPPPPQPPSHSSSSEIDSFMKTTPALLPSRQHATPAPVTASEVIAASCLVDLCMGPLKPKFASTTHSHAAETNAFDEDDEMGVEDEIVDSGVAPRSLADSHHQQQPNISWPMLPKGLFCEDVEMSTVLDSGTAKTTLTCMPTYYSSPRVEATETSEMRGMGSRTTDRKTPIEPPQPLLPRSPNHYSSHSSNPVMESNLGQEHSVEFSHRRRQTLSSDERRIPELSAIFKALEVATSCGVNSPKTSNGFQHQISTDRHATEGHVSATSSFPADNRSTTATATTAAPVEIPNSLILVPQPRKHTLPFASTFSTSFGSPSESHYTPQLNLVSPVVERLSLNRERQQKRQHKEGTKRNNHELEAASENGTKKKQKTGKSKSVYDGYNMSLPLTLAFSTPGSEPSTSSRVEKVKKVRAKVVDKGQEKVLSLVLPSSSSSPSLSSLTSMQSGSMQSGHSGGDGALSPRLAVTRSRWESEDDSVDITGSTLSSSSSVSFLGLRAAVRGASILKKRRLDRAVDFQKDLSATGHDHHHTFLLPRPPTPPPPPPPPPLPLQQQSPFSRSDDDPQLVDDFSTLVLDDKIWTRIFGFLFPSELGKISSVSRHWKKLIEGLLVWKKIVQRSNIGAPKLKYPTFHALALAYRFFICDFCLTVGKKKCPESDIPLKIKVDQRNQNKEKGIGMMTTFEVFVCLPCRVEYYRQHPEPEIVDEKERMLSKTSCFRLFKLKGSDLDKIVQESHGDDVGSTLNGKESTLVMNTDTTTVLLFSTTPSLSTLETTTGNIAMEGVEAAVEGAAKAATEATAEAVTEATTTTATTTTLNTATPSIIKIYDFKFAAVYAKARVVHGGDVGIHAALKGTRSKLCARFKEEFEERTRGRLLAQSKSHSSSSSGSGGDDDYKNDNDDNGHSEKLSSKFKKRDAVRVEESAMVDPKRQIKKSRHLNEEGKRKRKNVSFGTVAVIGDVEMGEVELSIGGEQGEKEGYDLDEEEEEEEEGQRSSKLVLAFARNRDKGKGKARDVMPPEENVVASLLSESVTTIGRKLDKKRKKGTTKGFENGEKGGWNMMECEEIKLPPKKKKKTLLLSSPRPAWLPTSSPSAGSSNLAMSEAAWKSIQEEEQDDAAMDSIMDWIDECELDLELEEVLEWLWMNGVPPRDAIKEDLMILKWAINSGQYHKDSCLPVVY